MKKLTRQLLIALFAIASLIAFEGCKKDKDVPAVTDLNQLYANAISDAMITEDIERIDTLWPISNTNSRLQWKTVNGKQYVLMATFMRFPASYPEGDSITTTWGDAWLFAPQQMKMRIGGSFKAGIAADTLTRICQLLGLPPVNSHTNTHIAELWVPVDSLQRPAGNPDIRTTAANEILIGTATPAYTNWFNNYIIYAYYHTLTSATDFHYPWTRLGYTFDWAPGSREVGLSEFVLRAKTGCWVNKTRTASNYFKE